MEDPRFDAVVRIGIPGPPNTESVVRRSGDSSSLERASGSGDSHLHKRGSTDRRRRTSETPDNAVQMWCEGPVGAPGTWLLLLSE